MFFKRGSLFLFLLVGTLSLSAQDRKPCLIFSGEAGDEYAIDLEKYNCIYFKENSMSLVNSESPNDSMELLYATYNQFRVDDAYVSNAVAEISDTDLSIIYNDFKQTLDIGNKHENSYIISVYDMRGMLMLKGHVEMENSFSVESLKEGIYVAAIVGEKTNKTLKFIKK